EIVPFVLEPKVFRFGFNEKDVEGNVRAIIEAQFLSMKLHSQWIKEKPKEIYATGGASANKEVLQVIANIFNTPVKQFEITDSAALGAALRTVKSYYESIGIKCRWKDIVNNYLKLQKYVTIEPEKNYKKIYEDMLKIYKKYENYVVRNRDNPEFFRKKFIKKYF
ncbi:MAG TPA: FGGY-family carbohydrate kinase, partial [Candidatus Lokiarchaeia archaeon]